MLKENYQNNLQNLSDSLIRFDQEIYKHCLRVSDICQKIAISMGYIDPILLQNLKIGGYFHDIGKIKIDPQILHKPGQLTADERKQIDKHSIIGFFLLKNQNISPHSLEIVKNHHSKDSETKDLNIATKILMVADNYDALVSTRDYKPTYSNEEAVSLMEYNPNLDQSIVTALSNFLNQKTPFYRTNLSIF